MSFEQSANTALDGKQQAKVIKECTEANLGKDYFKAAQSILTQ